MDSKSAVLPIAGDLPARRLYAYSVIPGGVQSAQELLAAVRNDSLVRSHYADFNVENALVTKLDRDRAVYVSYRLDGKIFWTNHKVALHRGETLITDGSHLARTRCGNRVSDTPQSPVSPAQPTMDALDHFAPVGDLYTTNLPIQGSLVPPPGFSLPSPANDPVSPLPFFPFIPGPGGLGASGSSVTNSQNGPVSPTGSGSPSGSPSGPGSPDAPVWPGEPGVPPGTDGPPVTTPEPGTLLLLGAGLSGLGFVRKLRNRS